MHTALARAAVYGTVYCCIPESLSISHLRWHPPNAELGSTAGERGPTPERVGFTVSGRVRRAGVKPGYFVIPVVGEFAQVPLPGEMTPRVAISTPYLMLPESGRVKTNARPRLRQLVFGRY